MREGFEVQFQDVLNFEPRNSDRTCALGAPVSQWKAPTNLFSSLLSPHKHDGGKQNGQR